MIDDNWFNVETNEYEVCAACGHTHRNDKYCPGMKMVKKKHAPWICSRINMNMYYPIFEVEEEMI